MSFVSDVALSPAAVPGLREASVAGKQTRSDTIQYLRAAAATAVVVYHASVFLEQQRGDASFHGVFDSRFGLYGVAIFFAISGFLMAQLVRRADPWTFLAHRIIRIYPPFLGAVLLAYGLSRFTGVPFAYDGPPPNGTAITHLFSVALVPAGERVYPLGVEWTLVFETTFYVVMTLVAWAKLQRHLVALAVAWIAIIVAVAWYTPGTRTDLLLPIHLILLSPANVAFAGGLLIPTLAKKGWLPTFGALLIVPLALAYDLFSEETNRILGGAAAVLLVGWATQRTSRQPNRPLLALGDASYVLYLIHVPVILGVFKLLPSTVGAWLAWPIAVAAAFAVAVPLGSLDIGLYRRLKGIVDAADFTKVKLGSLTYLTGFFAVSAVAGVLVVQEQRAEANIRTSLRQIGPASLGSPEEASARIRSLGLGLASFAGAMESADAAPSGQIILRGWALDRDSPKQSLRFVTYCGGQQIVPGVVSRRWRKDVAETLDRPDLSRVRIGFALIFVQRPSCPGDAPVLVLAFNDAGKVAVVPGAFRIPR